MEILKAAVLLAVATAVAALMLYAFGHWPKALPYGEVMPYITFRNTSKGVEIGLFDYSGAAPAAAYIYVNGKPAGAGKGWTGVYVKCGDRVEALIQYGNSPDGRFQRKLEGVVSCSKPLSARASPSGINPASLKLIEAFSAANGYMDIEGIPIEAKLICDTSGASIYDNRFQVELKVISRDTTMCVGDYCVRILTLLSGSGWEMRGPGSKTAAKNVKILRPPSAFLTNYLGGVDTTFIVNAYFDYASYPNYEYTSWKVYLTVVDYQGSRAVYLGECYKSKISYQETHRWTEYRLANASAVVDFCWQIEKGVGVNAPDLSSALAWVTPVVRVTSIVWTDKKGNVVAAKIYASPVDDASECRVTIPIRNITMHNNYVQKWETIKNSLIDGIINGAYSEKDREVIKGMIDFLISQGYTPEEAFKKIFFTPGDAVFGQIPQVALNRSSIVTLYKQYFSVAQNTYRYKIGIASMYSLGAVLALSAMPLPFPLPKVQPPPGNFTVPAIG
ncbi:hypothetical protein [Pyrobaculum arsenaticum]|uniref:Uncharacterized protein n=2 Tax=Pyrobaculum arsenaticum TaxID=121277 RepID=A4WKV3_PYRAR|nr:hypothetical protein [Pyrobaculum arsenaticum]ABP51020.1 hypothetical protein Pars_1463 [Pyrobaculum arsenaticum DSM 13514]